MRNPRKTMVSEMDVSSAPFIAGPPSSLGFLPLVDQVRCRLQKKDAFAGGTPSAKASEVSDTPSETPEAGRGYEPPVSSDDYLRGSVLLPFSMGDLRDNPKGCLGGKIFTLSISPCQAQNLLLPTGDPGARRDRGQEGVPVRWPAPRVTSQVRERRPRQKPTRKLPCRTSVFDS